MLTSDISTSINSAQLQGIERLSTLNAKKMSKSKIDETAKNFEALFITQMLGQMFGESLGTELFGDKQTSEIYKSMMMDQYGQEIVRSGGIGIADYIKAELIKQQEA